MGAAVARERPPRRSCASADLHAPGDRCSLAFLHCCWVQIWDLGEFEFLSSMMYVAVQADRRCASTQVRRPPNLRQVTIEPTCSMLAYVLCCLRFKHGCQLQKSHRAKLTNAGMTAMFAWDLLDEEQRRAATDQETVQLLDEIDRSEICCFIYPLMF